MSTNRSESERLVLLGATGFTGGLVARELVRSGHGLILTGRDRRKLEPLAAELGELPTRSVDVTDPTALAQVIRPGRVVINCAGPFTELGEPVVRACVDSGAHYLDTTGEQLFMKLVEDRYAERARAAGVAVVNAMAFEFALGDFAAEIAAENMDSPLDALHVFYLVHSRPGASSPATRRSILHVLAGRSLAYVDGDWRAERTGSRRRSFRLTRGRPRSASNFPAGEVVTVPRHIRASEVRGWISLGRGTATLISAAGRVPGLFRAARPLLARMAGRGPAGPDEEKRRRSTFLIRAEAVGADGACREVTLQGRDPYGITAALVAQAAVALLESPPPAGVLAPAQILPGRATLDGLREVGLDWQVDAPGS